MADDREVRIPVEEDAVLVSNANLRSDRLARLFFSSILGAQEVDDGWRCPRRRMAMSSLVVRINKFLESKGWKVDRAGFADEAVERELERDRSFCRTRERAIALRQGQSAIDLQDIEATLRAFGWDEAARPLLEHQRQGALHGLNAG